MKIFLPVIFLSMVGCQNMAHQDEIDELSARINENKHLSGTLQETSLMSSHQQSLSNEARYLINELNIQYSSSDWDTIIDQDSQSYNQLKTLDTQLNNDTVEFLRFHSGVYIDQVHGLTVDKLKEKYANMQKTYNEYSKLQEETQVRANTVATGFLDDNRNSTDIVFAALKPLKNLRIKLDDFNTKVIKEMSPDKLSTYSK